MSVPVIVHTLKDHFYAYCKTFNRVIIVSPETTIKNLNLNLKYVKAHKINVYDDYIDVFNNPEHPDYATSFSTIVEDEWSANKIVIWSNSDNGELLETLLM